ncbi:M23 family metallopeptidase [Flavisolibacter ginsenosidimutans]|uniref:M23 family metallopeptidase n=1 Tax=Flavisolibacter ginsenosidimutans TaxID=661481 RepID=A0A5B8UL77_9BACT|nr:M23 family metallopeptidase [Flavisolibacter ginsenosidimutans]QEC57308.1 M23 family metallopeptidase [Flavisolibacter ginsenosidimutans]
MKVFVLLLFAALSSCAVLQSNEFISRAVILAGNHNNVYFLPYESGTAHYVVQGYESLFSHHGDFAIDFKMKPGTKVMAARSGVVVFVRQSTARGGVGKRYAGTGNGVTVKHSDCSFAHYWHLQQNGALVSVGDSVEQGQCIGLSGSTGFSAFPHLHFEVTRALQKKRTSFPVPFLTEKGAKFLQPLRRYKAM